jgi:hypothetical protein
MQLDLNDEQTAALLRELDLIIDGDRFPLSPRIRTLKEIRAKSDRSEIGRQYRRPSITSHRAFTSSHTAFVAQKPSFSLAPGAFRSVSL